MSEKLNTGYYKQVRGYEGAIFCGFKTGKGPRRSA
jgi:hypothetical protein